MELKVWVDGVVRVVCGLSYTTSCQDVVIALAQAIGQTGRYILVLKLRGTERQLLATDCPLQAVAQLGQQATEVQFVLRRTGHALSDGPHESKTDGQLLLPRQPEPPSQPQKAQSFHLGPSTFPRRKRTRAYSPSPRASPEPRASPVSFQEPVHPVKTSQPLGSKEEAFRQILKQQEWLYDLEVQLQALKCELRDCERSSGPTPVPSPTPSLEEELEELETRTRQNEAELMHAEHWEEQLEEELDLEDDMHGRLDTISSNIDDHISRLQDLQAHSTKLGHDLQLEQSSVPQPDDHALPSLRQELQSRLQEGNALAALLSEKERELQAVKVMLEERSQLMEECDKDLRQLKLQQFIQQAGVTAGPPDSEQWENPYPPDPSAQWENPYLPAPSDRYLSNAGLMEDDLNEAVSVC
ncbi:ras association domain-containing protein 8-like isoform X1 [Gadus chalcogrammus]|uniref:ras association domain-containing protein 8-like isoform X1 n=1 Tax=Gadus chalcogrammus TaxID=1042646 RepID=UPI0024C489FB|nr:ras association domain-containing protein 8-like isoform X1 [Gadus chalcogrammus]XP_056464444.1 ras association domain-containing protein 8-like isoform X1 [Gadus chalcogrammus]